MKKLLSIMIVMAMVLGVLPVVPVYVAATELLVETVAAPERIQRSKGKNIGVGTSVEDMKEIRPSFDSYWYSVWGDGNNTADAIAYFNYNISTLNTQKLKKVYFSPKFDGNSTKYKPFALKLHEVKDDSWTRNTITATNQPVFSSNPIGVGLQLSNEAGIAASIQELKAIYASCDYIIDVTDYILQEKALGESSTSMLLSTTNIISQNNFYVTESPFLVYYYSDNNNPTISAISIDDIIGIGKEIPMSAVLSDSDGSIKGVKVTFDDTVLYNNEDISSASYDFNYTIPSENVTAGNHKIIVETIDNFGAKAFYVKNILVANYVVSGITFSNGNSGSAVLTAGATVKASTNVAYVGMSPTSDVTIIMALYSPNNALIKLAYTPYSITTGGNENVSAQFILPDDVVDYTNYKVQSFIWNNMNNMFPISNVATLDTLN